MLDTVKIQEAIDAFIESDPEEDYRIHIPPRSGERKYLGISAIGEECMWKIWASFRKLATSVSPPRMKRLWRRGDREEFVFNFLLRGIGFEIFEVGEDGKQFKITDFEGHLSGHMDGVGKAPKKFWKKGFKPVPFLMEHKTYNKERFRNLTKTGVRRSDPKYFIQMQGYMGYENLSGALFCAVCKDDDHLYFEWVPFNQNVFDTRIVQVAEEVITTMKPNLPKISSTPSDWRCKFCEYCDVCHKGAESLKSCRSCKFAEPAENASWTCTKGKAFGTLCDSWKDIAKR